MTGGRRAGATLAIALLGAAAVAQAPTEAELAAVRASDAARRNAHYLAAVRALEPAAFDPTGKPIAGLAFQYWQQMPAALVSERTALSPYSPGPVDPDIAARLRTATLVDALPEIVRRARATSIVFLNEAHDTPRDRAFALEVARALRPLGYRTLAVETLANDADAAVSAAKMATLAREGYARRATGSYSQDPVFADFLRQALALGYRPVAYEQTDNTNHEIAGREQAQADYLVARALPNGTDDTLLVYVGYSHATEAPIAGRDDKPERWLATRLKAMTGIDPLTIDQTTVAENPAGDPDGQNFAIVAPRLGTRSAVLMAAGKPLVVGQYAGAVDLQVVHPPMRRVNGRPEWLAAMARAPVPVPPALVPKAGTRLVQAFGATDGDDAVPIDQVLITAGQPVPSLMLPPGRAVRYAVEDSPAD